MGETWSKIADQMGVNRNTLRVRVMREGWNNKMGIVLPVTQSLIPTSSNGLQSNRRGEV